ncbi:uncharacterized protein LOC113296075 [Papaver somniferum]|uniref:uncharacterized protein LOC113296075 n=1 Tax=Papaver somniferum TaxID=3469 RepID=UPI000E6FB485|nr:uncharacterized protein LOC113296075 [Papaver somniferum]
MKTTKANFGVVGIKWDMAKAFDRIEWDFLQAIMSSLGFSQKWCQLIHHCISTAKISILVNGTPMDFFSPTRGLRKGFSRLLTNAATENIIEPVTPAKTGPTISHLLFADDCILFTKATKRSINNLKILIQKFTSSSGQMVNLDKSSVFFSKNMSKEECSDFIEMLQMEQMEDKEKYLGTILQTPISKDKLFDPAVDKVGSRLQMARKVNFSS